MHRYILQIDTATEVCSVSISLNGKTIHSIEAEEPNLHATQLTLFIDELLRKSDISYADLSAVCVSKGPGSYTGLRIGVSTAKGLCYALDIPLLSINTLDMMFHAYAASIKTDIIYVPMLDARRMEVYLQVFDINGLLVPTEAVIVDENTFQSYADKQVILFGSGAQKLMNLFQHHDGITIDTNFVHSSSYMSELAYNKLNVGDIEDLIYFEPFYLKEFIASTPKKLL